MKRLAGRLWGDVVAGAGQLHLARRERMVQAQKLQALQLLETIANSSTDAIFAKDAKGRYILFNRAAAALVGKPAEAVLGQDDTALFPPQQVEAIMAVDRQVLTSGPMVTLEQELSLPAGPRTFLTTKGVLRDADGTVSGLFGIARDITERKRAEREIQALNAGLEQRVAERTAALEAEIAERRRVEAQLRDSEQRFRELNANLERQLEIRNELGLTELPVIALTASVRDEDRQQAFAAGVNDFLGKPVPLEELTDRLQRWTSPAPVAEDVPVSVLAAPAPAVNQKPSSGMPEIPGFDARQVALAFGNDRAFFLELLEMFCATFGDTAQQLRTDLARGDRAAAARRLHTLRGTGGTLGALELMRSAQVLERAIVDGRPEVERLLEQFTAQFADLIQAAAPWIRRTPPRVRRDKK